jgi:hypothetical protein
MYVPSYTGPWLVQGTNEGEQAEQALWREFKGKSKTHDAGELHELDRDMCEVWEDAESGSRLVLQQFLAWVSNFPPVQKCLVQGVLSGGKQRSLLKTKNNGEGQNATDLEIEVPPTLNRYCCGRNGDYLM